MREALTPLCARAGLPVPIAEEGPPRAFRLRARLAVRGRVTSPKIGIFEEGSHRVVDIPQCLVHHPLINDVARAVKAAIRSTGAPPYSDAAHQGLVRYVQIVVERATERAQVVVVTHSEGPDRAEPLLRELCERLGDKLQGLYWNGNTARSNTILGDRFVLVSGSPLLEERFGGVRVFFPPGAFGQNNVALAERLIESVRADVPAGARVAEFYAGTGAIGLGLLERSAAVAFNEISPAGVEGLRHGIGARPEIEQARATVLEGPAGAHASLVQESDTVIVDPPRKGLDTALLRALVDNPPERLLYVACGLKSFIADATTLLDAGLTLTGLSAFDLFTYTEHVELFGRFERAH